MARRILLVEDDANLAAVLSDTLESAGYRVENTSDGQAAVECISKRPFDLVLLDVVLPGENGFTVCRRLRREGIHTPVLMLTALSDPSHRVQGLTEGADDYLTKPFDPAELLARIQALLRREGLYRSLHLNEYRFGDVLVDFFKGIAIKKGARLNLSVKELQLLRYLISRRDAIVSREELLREVWGYPDAITRTVDVHIATLRQKLEDDPQHPVHVVTVRGEGYRFRG